MHAISIDPVCVRHPMIYAYTTPGVANNDGWVKIGYTDRDPDQRIREQTHTAGIVAKREWSSTAIYDSQWKPFRDTDCHRYLRCKGVEQRAGTEWFRMAPDVAK